MPGIFIQNVIAGLTEGQTLSEDSLHGALAGEHTFPLSITAVSDNGITKNIVHGPVSIQGSYGTLVMNADGSYSYAAQNNISFPPDGVVQDTFTLNVADNHGDTAQITLTVSVVQPGMNYMAGTPVSRMVAGNASTVFDATLGFQYVNAGNGNDVVFGGTAEGITLGNGNDTVFGGEADVITLGNGNDVVTGGFDDSIRLGNGNNTITGGIGDFITAGNGNNKVTGAAEENILLGDGANTVTGGYHDVIDLGNGNNTVTGGLANSIFLGDGNNTVTGAMDDDILVGKGKNTITVGTDNTLHLHPGGTDTIIFNQDQDFRVGRQIINGFDPARDKLEFNSSLFPNFAAVLAHAHQSGSNTIISVGNSSTITLVNVALSSLQPSNIAVLNPVGPTVTIDAIDGNNVINAAQAHAGVALSGSVSGLPANSTFQVKVTDGAFSESYTATVNGAGTAWSAAIPVSDATTLANGTATVSAQVTDSTGHSATASQTVTVAETLPTVTINAIDGNNVVNNAQAHAGVTLGGSISGLAANSTFQVKVTDGAFSKSYTATVNGAGTGWSATIPASDATTLANGTATVSAQVTDQFGNQSATASQSVTVTETLPTVTINAVDGNNVINSSQALAGVALNGSVTGLAANSTFQVKVTDGAFSKSYTATVNGAGTGWSAAIPSSDATTLANGTATVSAQVTDQFGNQSSVASQSVTVAKTLPTVTINAVDGNNVINNAQAHAGVALSGSVSGLAANSTFQVTVTDGAFSKSYTATVNGTGTAWSATIPSSDATTLANGTATVSAQVTNSSGSATASRSVTVAETLPTVTINAVDGNNVINNAQAHAGVALGGSVIGLAANSTFQVAVSDGAFSKSYTATVNGAGTAWSATMPSGDATVLANGIATVSAQVTDQFGNQSTTASRSVTVAETLPTVTINAVDGNNAINNAQAHAGVALGGSVTGLAGSSTFQVTVTDGAFSKSYTATVNSGGTSWTATVPSADATGLANGTATVSAQVTDQFGNQSAMASQSVTVAETLPTVTINAVDGNNVINNAQAHAGVALGGSVTGLAGNSTFQVTVADGAFSKSYTATVNSGGTSWTAAIPSADAIALANGTATVSAEVTDQFGNQSTMASQSVTVAETLPTVTIDAVDGNNVITNAQAQVGVALSGAVTGLPANSTFQVTVTDGAFSKSYTATVNGAGTAWTATIPSGDATTLANGTATVSTQVTDPFGNQSATASQTVTVSETQTISYVWTGAGNGDWTDPNDWSSSVVPGAGAQAVMALSGAAQAAITTDVGSIGSLNLSGTGELVMPSSASALEVGMLATSGTLSIQQGQLTIDTALHNSNAILIDSAGTQTVSDAAELTSSNPDFVIDGSGTITLSNSLTPYDTSGLISTGNDRLAPLEASQANPATTLDNVDNTIQGSGHIGVGVLTADANGQPLPGDTFINEAKGIVKATGTDYLEINAASIVNHGVIEALGGTIDFSTHFVDTLNGGTGQIVQRGADLDNSDGTIVVSGAHANLNFLGTTIHGGTIETGPGGSLTFLKSGLSPDTKSKGLSNATTLDGTTTPLTITGTDPTTLGASFVLDETFAQGSIVNHSFMRIGGIFHPLNSGFASRAGALALSGNVTLSGGGTIDLERPSNALSNNLDVGIISESASNPVLTNVDNTISGAGTIGYAPDVINLTAPPVTLLTIVNAAAGSIVASADQGAGHDPFADRLDLVDVNLTNLGLVSATNTGGMLIDTSTIDNSGGTITADSSKSGAATTSIDVENSSVTGGTLAAESSGAHITVAGSSTLTDVAVTAAAKASVSIADSTVAGDNLAAEGEGASVTITNTALADSADSALSIAAIGSGANVTLNDDNLTATNASFEVDSGGTLTFNGNYDAAADTFTGSGGNIAITAESSLTTAGSMTVDALYSIGANAKLEIDDFQDGTAIFAAGGAQLTLDASQITSTATALVNFVNGDTLDLTQFDPASAQLSYSGDHSSGVLTITDIYGDVANLTLAYNQPASFFPDPTNLASDFTMQGDGNGGLSLQPDFGLASPFSTLQNGANPNAAGNSGPWNIGPNGDTPDITIAGDTTLEGGGAVELADGSIVSSGTTATFTNLDNTIGGTGTIGDADLALYNAPSGTIHAAAGDSLSIDTASTRNAGLIEADGGSISIANNVDDWHGQGVVSAQNGGSITIGGTLSGGGQNAIGVNATFEVGTVANGNTTFSGGDGTFILDHAANSGTKPGSISGFASGDQIDLRDITAGAGATLAYSGDATGGTLTVSDGGGNSVQLALFGNYLAQAGAPSAAHFTANSDGTPGGTVITTDITLPHG